MRVPGTHPDPRAEKRPWATFSRRSAAKNGSRSARIQPRSGKRMWPRAAVGRGELPAGALWMKR